MTLIDTNGQTDSTNADNDRHGENNMDEDCWYCQGWILPNQNGPLLHCEEFDCLLHLRCLQEAINQHDPNDRETPIIAEEFKDLLTPLP